MCATNCYLSYRHYEGEGAPMMGMGPRGKSQNQMMAEHLLREAVPLDKQLSSLLARRLNGEETLNIINQLRSVNNSKDLFLMQDFFLCHYRLKLSLIKAQAEVFLLINFKESNKQKNVLILAP